jgi:hypothetical protein
MLLTDWAHPHCAYMLHVCVKEFDYKILCVKYISIFFTQNLVHDSLKK